MDVLDVFVGIIGMMLIPLIISLAFYVMTALGLSKIAKDMGAEDKAFLAWIPIAQLYLVGWLVQELTIFGKEVPKLELVLCLGWIVNMIPIVGQIVYILYLIIVYAAYIELAGFYEPNNKVLYGIFCFIGFFLIGRRIDQGYYGDPQE